MPKEHRRKTNGHDQSVRLNKRQFTLGGDIDHVEIGKQIDETANDILSTLSSTETANISKKEKQLAKHEAFLQRLESGHAPYSKSHARRLKRKEKEKLVSGMEDVALALPSLDEDLSQELDRTQAIDPSNNPGIGPSRRTKPGLIGEGKGIPLSNKQRQKVLKTEKARQPLLLASKEFSTNPFAALRIHAQNTLVKHEKEK